MNWAPFATTGADAMIAVVFFARLGGFVSTSNAGNLILYVGGLIMLGIILMMVAFASEGKSTWLEDYFRVPLPQKNTELCDSLRARLGIRLETTRIQHGLCLTM